VSGVVLSNAVLAPTRGEFWRRVVVNRFGEQRLCWQYHACQGLVSAQRWRHGCVWWVDRADGTSGDVTLTADWRLELGEYGNGELGRWH
jgi:hypothetical protein